MKKSKEYKVSVILFSVALVMFAISFVTGLIPDFDYSIDKICMYLGFASLGFGLVFLKKSEKNDKQ